MEISEAVKLKAADLTRGAASLSEISRRICRFVQDGIRYSLKEWDMKAEEVLSQGQGMCAGKALLAVQLHQAAGIPARFKVIKVLGEDGIFAFVARCLEATTASPASQEQGGGVLSSLHSLPPPRDHIVVQVLLEGSWAELDLAQDSELKNGMRFIGIEGQRKVLSEEGPYSSLDRWLEERMLRRAITRDREGFFETINRHIEQVRNAGKLAEKAGVQVWTQARVREALEEWEVVPGWPAGPIPRDGAKPGELAEESRSVLGRLSPAARSRMEGELVEWLYALVRRNIKRGRLWELSDVMTQHRADCLGYARVLEFLARDFGLNAGVVEVVQDVAGRYVPHYVCLVNLGGHRMLVDPWYGSANVRHGLIIGRVREAEKLATRPLYLKAVEPASEVYGLGQEQVAGLSFYILGNSYLSRAGVEEAIECYGMSLWLYPANPRALFNRAVALDRMGKTRQAQNDYRQAFAMELALVRILATVETLEPLIELDERGVPEEQQQVYLLRKGFVTGEEEGWEDIASRCRSTVAEVQSKINLASAKLGSKASV